MLGNEFVMPIPVFAGASAARDEMGPNRLMTRQCGVSRLNDGYLRAESLSQESICVIVAGFPLA
jgi:hypothetical protein